MLKTLILSSVVLGAAAGFAHAQSLKPAQANTIDLGVAHGTAYYTSESNGYRVVATLDTGAPTPIRFDTTLADGQSAKISVPAGVGEAPVEVTFIRTADHVEIRKAGPTSDAVTASTH